MSSFGVSYRFQSSETELHWVELGKGRPVVLLHGLSDSHRTWRQVAPRLASNGFRVIVPDLAGHGLSGRPDASYSVDWHARVLTEWIAHLGLGRFDLIGHSFGGGIALQLLITHNKQIRKLVLVASGGFGVEVTAGVKLLSLPGADKVIQAGISVGTRVGLRFAAGGNVSENDRMWHAWANSAPGTGRALKRTVRESVGVYGQRESVYDNLERIDRLPPLILFWGDKDPVIPYSQAIQAAAHIPTLRLIRFRGCGHFPHLERHQDFNSALHAFLGRGRRNFFQRARQLFAPRNERMATQEG